MPFMAPLVTPPTQPTLKLSKLMNEAKQLGCETFFSIVGVVAAKRLAKKGFRHIDKYKTR